MGYTWAQATAYLKMARQDHARHRLEALVDQSNAFAGGEGARNLVRLLGAAAKD